MKEVSNSNDLNLSQWGPYSTRTFGISCIHDPETGSRMDFTPMPGFYRRNFAIPDARRQSGGIPWQTSADLRYYSYRQQMEWKDKVYADLEFIACGEKCRLISCTFVNRKKRCQDLAFNLLCRLFPGPSVPFSVPGAAEILSPVLPGCGLNFDAYRPGEEASAESLPGGTIFRIKAGQNVSFEAEEELKNKKVWLLKKNGQTEWTFQQLAPAEGKYIRYTAEEDELLNRAFVMTDDRTPELFLREENTSAQVEEIADGKYLLSFGGEKCYALYFLSKPTFHRRYHLQDVDTFYLTSDQVFQKHLGEDFRQPGAKESAFAVAVQPLTVPGNSEENVKFYVASGTHAEMECFLQSPPPAAEDVRPVSFPASPFSFSTERMAATVMTNVIYPVRCNGELIRHHTPGRLWNSLYTWDSGFIGLALLEMDVRRAIENLNAYLTEAGDTVNAFIHHGTPLPVQIFLFYEIWNRTCDLQFLQQYYPRVKQMYLYLAGHTPGSDTRSHCTLPLICTWNYFYNSGGWDDYPPQWNRLKQPSDAAVIPMISSSAILRSAKMLLALGRILGEDTAVFEQDIADISAALQVAWDPETEYFGYLKTNADGTPGGILRYKDGSNYNMGLDGVSPLYAGEITPEQKKKLWAKVKGSKHLWTKYGISAVDQSASYFSLEGYWNGSIWLPHQWFLWKAALNDGLGKFAQKIAMTALRMWERETQDAYCCFEHFSISTGSGIGWHHFSGLSSPILCWHNAYFKDGTLTCGNDVLITSRKDGEYQLEISGNKGEKTSLIYCGNPEKILYNGTEIAFTRETEKTVLFDLPKGSAGTLCIVR